MRRGLAVPAVFTTISLTILLALGFWQWNRRAEKLALIQTIEQRVGAEPVAAPAPAAWPGLNAADHIYRPVKATGRFDHAREAHVFFALAKEKNGHGGPGYLVVTPFHLAGGGTILVNRGFTPQRLKEAASRLSGQVEGEAEITGLFRAPEPRNAFSGKDDPARNIFFVRDPAELAAAKGLGQVAPYLIDLRSPEPPGGLPVPGVTQVDIRNNHLQYAITWWSLAAILAAIFLIYARRDAR
jgi:surfeit locus 1 family protein